MVKPAYYNEIDKYAAQWLRNLIAAGHIAPGDVDDRSILDVSPDDLAGYTQCHFFAGIGVWSHALRRAGWPDGQEVWTGSCPCQPFSVAGMGSGFNDERHLWPHFFHLIEQRRPAKVFGEQVASKDADPWIDLVQADLEAVGYAVGALAFPAASIGAPHIRDRLYWVADSDSEWRHNRRRMYRGRAEESCREETPLGSELRREAEGNRSFNRLGNADLPRLEGLGRGHQAEGGRIGAAGSVAEAGEFGGLADAKQHCSGCEAAPADNVRAQADRPADQHGGHCGAFIAWPGPANGHWRDADWLLCRDGKWRPVEPGTFPLAHGVAARVGRLRAYGNAIVAAQAQAFIEIAMQYRP